MKSEFTLAFNEIAERSKLDRATIIESIEAAVISAYRKAAAVSGTQQIEATVDPDTGVITIYAEKEVVDGPAQDPRTEVTLDDVRDSDPDIQVGDLAKVDSTALFQGRIPAQTAKQVILQKLKEAERESQYQEYLEREGDLVHGTVQSTGAHGVTVSLGRAEAMMPRNQTMPRERFRAHDKVRAYVLEVRRTPRGPQIILSRTHRNMLRRLLEMEVPEVYSGIVEIKSISREAGQRSKIAVHSTQDGVDPVGACVGMRGVRIQSIVKELSDEKIDVIEWNPDQAIFIIKALSPSRVAKVYLEEAPTSGRTATVIVPDDQLSLAIGREGQNARLAAKLTGWRIDIKSLSEAAQETIELLSIDETCIDLASDLETELIQARLTLAKMAEKRPIMPEEYTILTTIVDAVESRRHDIREAEIAAEQEILETVRASIPNTAYSISLEDDGLLPPRLLATLIEAGYQHVGEVLEQLAVDSDKILSLSGIGPKVLSNMQEKLIEAAQREPQTSDGEEDQPQIESSPDSDDLDPETIIESAADADIPAEPSETLAEPEMETIPEDALSGVEEAGPAQDTFDEQDDLEILEAKKDKTKKEKRTVVYDDERDVYITTHKHKRGTDDDTWMDMLDDE